MTRPPFDESGKPLAIERLGAAYRGIEALKPEIAACRAQIDAADSYLGSPGAHIKLGCAWRLRLRMRYRRLKELARDYHDQAVAALNEMLPVDEGGAL